MNFIDKQNGLGFFLQFGNNAFKALLKITAKFRPGQHPAQVEGKNFHVFK